MTILDPLPVPRTNAEREAQLQQNEWHPQPTPHNNGTARLPMRKEEGRKRKKQAVDAPLQPTTQRKKRQTKAQKEAEKEAEMQAKINAQVAERMQGVEATLQRFMASQQPPQGTPIQPP